LGARWPKSRGSNPGRGNRFFIVHNVQTLSITHSASYTVGTGPVSLGVKRYRREAEHPPPCDAEVKNGGAIVPLPNKSSKRGV
jgi:hypothetical protein